MKTLLLFPLLSSLRMSEGSFPSIDIPLLPSLHLATPCGRGEIFCLEQMACVPLEPQDEDCETGSGENWPPTPPGPLICTEGTIFCIEEMRCVPITPAFCEDDDDKSSGSPDSSEEDSGEDNSDEDPEGPFPPFPPIPGVSCDDGEIFCLEKMACVSIQPTDDDCNDGGQGHWPPTVHCGEGMMFCMEKGRCVPIRQEFCEDPDGEYNEDSDSSEESHEDPDWKDPPPYPPPFPTPGIPGISCNDGEIFCMDRLACVPMRSEDVDCGDKDEPTPPPTPLPWPTTCSDHEIFCVDRMECVSIDPDNCEDEDEETGHPGPVGCGPGTVFCLETGACIDAFPDDGICDDEELSGESMEDTTNEPTAWTTYPSPGDPMDSAESSSTPRPAITSTLLSLGQYSNSENRGQESVLQSSTTETPSVTAQDSKKPPILVLPTGTVSTGPDAMTTASIHPQVIPDRPEILVTVGDLPETTIVEIGVTKQVTGSKVQETTTSDEESNEVAIDPGMTEDPGDESSEEMGTEDTLTQSSEEKGVPDTNEPSVAIEEQTLNIALPPDTESQTSMQITNSNSEVTQMSSTTTDSGSPGLKSGNELKSVMATVTKGSPVASTTKQGDSEALASISGIIDSKERITEEAAKPTAQIQTKQSNGMVTTPTMESSEEQYPTDPPTIDASHSIPTDSESEEDTDSEESSEASDEITTTTESVTSPEETKPTTEMSQERSPSDLPTVDANQSLPIDSESAEDSDSEGSNETTDKTTTTTETVASGEKTKPTTEISLESGNPPTVDQTKEDSDSEESTEASDETTTTTESVASPQETNPPAEISREQPPVDLPTVDATHSVPIDSESAEGSDSESEGSNDATDKTTTETVASGEETKPTTEISLESGNPPTVDASQSLPMDSESAEDSDSEESSETSDEITTTTESVASPEEPKPITEMSREQSPIDLPTVDESHSIPVHSESEEDTDSEESSEASDETTTTTESVESEEKTTPGDETKTDASSTTTDIKSVTSTDSMETVQTTIQTDPLPSTTKKQEHSTVEPDQQGEEQPTVTTKPKTSTERMEDTVTTMEPNSETTTKTPMGVESTRSYRRRQSTPMTTRQTSPPETDAPITENPGPELPPPEETPKRDPEKLPADLAVKTDKPVQIQWKEISAKKMGAAMGRIFSLF